MSNVDDARRTIRDIVSSLDDLKSIIYDLEVKNEELLEKINETN